jgi:putative transcriptional regulator
MQTLHGSRMKNHLTTLRAARDWSQVDLAGHLGVSRHAVMAIEAGKHDPSLALAFRIARLFDLRIEQVFEDCPQNPSPQPKE